MGVTVNDPIVLKITVPFLESMVTILHSHLLNWLTILHNGNLQKNLLVLVI